MTEQEKKAKENQALEKTIVPALLNWYDYNARILPWRSEPTPYHVWISEIMLQQTRVEAVKPYYDRFLNEIPDIESLAKVEEEKLMKLWQGLGYYNRARNLKTAAITIVEQYDGIMPGSYEKILALKGIGEYTAGAISSIAYQIPVPAVDGNVLRVIARIEANEEDILKASTKRRVREELLAIIPHDRAGDFNQALMELGATVCLPNGKPLCDKCPWDTICQAYKQDRVMELPVKQPKKKRKIEKRTVLLLYATNKELAMTHKKMGEKTDETANEATANETTTEQRKEGKIALVKRPKSGLLAGLWEFPNESGTLRESQVREKLAQWGIKSPYKIQKTASGKHIFSHIEWHMSGYFIEIEQVPNESELTWVSREEMREGYAIPSAYELFLKELDKYTTQ